MTLMEMTDEPKPLLVWLDLETTGLDPVRHTILEISAIATTADLEYLGSDTDRFRSLVTWDGDTSGMHEAVVKMHSENGLFDELRDSANDAVPLAEVDEAFASWLDSVLAFSGLGSTDLAANRTRVLAGDSVHFDLSFINTHLPMSAERLHYRVFNVSTLRQAAAWWADEDIAAFDTNQDAQHRATADIARSLDRARFVRARIRSGWGAHPSGILK